MEQVSKNELSAFEEATGEKKNGTINVLTILTFIGCGIQFIMVFATKWLMSFAMKMANNPEVLEKMSTKEREQMLRGKEAFDMYMQYQIPLVIMSLISIALCVYGAIQMRKLKKQGFYAYVVGEWMPLIGSTALMGFSLQFSGGVMSIILSLAIPVLFTILYGVQLKRMK
jgi:hypothetical protein